MDMQQMAQENLIYRIIVGSHLYGTALHNSDTDYFGVCIPPKDCVLGIHKFEVYAERTVDNDFTIYSLQKYFKLLAEGNPNIVESLFAPNSCVLFCNELGQEILNNKHLFLSRRIYYKFLGYATSQKRKLIEKKAVGVRSKLVEIYGYDTKYASHLIRLLYFGAELLDTGNLKFPTEWAKHLISIKNGQWPISAIIDKANYLESILDSSFKNTILPKSANIEGINKLQISLIERHWEEKEGNL